MRSTNLKGQQSGFTLIELVVVIVILGILAATAIPRFMGVSKEAREASVKGLYGAVQSAMALAHAQALVQNQTGATGSITMEGQTVKLVYGYPDSTDGIDKALSTADGFTFTAGVAPAAATFTVTASPAYTAANCGVTYTPATSSAAASATMGVANCD